MKKVIQRYHQLHPTKIVHKITKAQREKRQRKGLDVSPTIHKWQQLMDNSFTVPFE